MRVAVPIWMGRVSPVFDTAGRLLLADIDGGKVSAAAEELLEERQWHIRARKLSLMKVDVLICAGISPGLLDTLTGSGIRVIPGVAGDVDQVLNAFSSGRLSSPRFLMPGWSSYAPGMARGRRCRGWRRRCRRGRIN